MVFAYMSNKEISEQSVEKIINLHQQQAISTALRIVLQVCVNLHSDKLQYMYLQSIVMCGIASRKRRKT